MHRSRVKYFIEIIIHGLFWLGVYYVLRALTAVSYSMVSDHNNGSTQRIDVRVFFPYSGIVLGSLMLLFYSNTFWLFKKVLRYKRDLLRVTAIAGWFILLFGVNYMVIHMLLGPSRSIPFPEKKAWFIVRSDTGLIRTSRNETSHGTRADTLLIDTQTNMAFQEHRPDLALSEPRPPFGSSAGDSWSRMQPIMALIFLAVLAIAAADFFIKEWVRNDLKRSQAEANQLSTEIRFLRSQVNPHFLFNTLNNLFSMAQKRGNDELADGISKLSGMMRYMIYESNTDSVSLQKEIEYLKDCIALNKLRYADNEVLVTFSHPALAESAAVQVSPMLFIPFLENAFKHGVSIGSHSRIAMEISIEQKRLIFTCENADHSAVKKLEEERAGIGLENVRRRLELLYPGRYELRASPSAGKYTVNLQIEWA
jgi:two-component system LytT family sensor kinase